MSKNFVMKLFLAISLLIATIFFVLNDNEIIFPSTLVGFFLALTLFKSPNTKRTGSEKAAHYAIVYFSILVLVLNILVSVFLPGMAKTTKITKYYTEQTTDIKANDTKELDNHFVDVTINDAHELCYTTSLLLLFYLIFLGIFCRKDNNIKL